MKIIVTGGRDFLDKQFIYKTLESLHPTYIIHGGATGADSLAGDFAKEKNIIECVYKANWNLHGKKAGPIRNKEMCHENQDATLVAFPGGKGTANCIQEATCIGMNIIKVKYEQSAG